REAHADPLSEGGCRDGEAARRPSNQEPEAAVLPGGVSRPEARRVPRPEGSVEPGRDHSRRLRPLGLPRARRAPASEIRSIREEVRVYRRRATSRGRPRREGFPRARRERDRRLTVAMHRRHSPTTSRRVTAARLASPSGPLRNVISAPWPPGCVTALATPTAGLHDAICEA